MSKADIVFGESAATIKAWSKTTTEAFGITQRGPRHRRHVRCAVRTDRDHRPEAAKQAQRLTELGADLAVVLQHRRPVRARRDPVRPRRRSGTAPAVRRPAVRNPGAAGGDGRHRQANARALTAQEKALARIRIILKDTEDGAGRLRPHHRNTREPDEDRGGEHRRTRTLGR